MPKDKQVIKNDKQTGENEKPRIRIKIKAFDHKIIDRATKTIIDTAHKSQAQVKGPIPLPTEKAKYTVNRSTFVHKDSREQYERTRRQWEAEFEAPALTCPDSLYQSQC